VCVPPDKRRLPYKKESYYRQAVQPKQSQASPIRYASIGDLLYTVIFSTQAGGTLRECILHCAANVLPIVSD
ncbi:MAG: hypothetical protein AAFQ63_23415, partial [Cyanobacteria bacterium J06621_11]